MLLPTCQIPWRTPRDGTGNPHATVSRLCPKDGGMWHKDNTDSPGKTKGKPNPHFPQESRELEMTRWAFVYLNLNLIPLVTKKEHGDTSWFQWTFSEPCARHCAGGPTVTKLHPCLQRPTVTGNYSKDNSCCHKLVAHSLCRPGPDINLEQVRKSPEI